jgi:hypothetical protein
LFNVRQGVITGNNRAFLLSAVGWRALPEPERSYFMPAIVNSSIENARIIPNTYVFFPHGKRELADEQSLKAAVPAFYEGHLLQYKANLAARRRVPDDRWWQLSEYRKWQLTPTPKIVSTYFGDVGSFAWDATAQFAVVQGYGWLMKPSAGKTSRKLWLAYIALLNSQVFSTLLSAVSNHVGGGQWNLSRRFVDPIPLPDLRLSPQGDLVGELSKCGEWMYEGRAQVGSPTGTLPLLKELAEAAYGIGPL